MGAVFEIKILPEGTIREFVFLGGSCYLLEDGTLMPMYSTLAWCRQCKDFREAECLDPTLADIDQRLAELRDPNSEFYQWVDDERGGRGRHFRVSELARWEKRRKWRERRTASPKCLFCGSPEIVILPIEIGVPSPFSIGTLDIKGIGHQDTPTMDWIFSAEGDRIQGV